jgi:hypothetical protein
MFFKVENEGISDDDIDDIGKEKRREKNTNKTKRIPHKSAIYNWASSRSDIKTKALKNGGNRLSNKERESGRRRFSWIIGMLMTG